MLVVTVHLASAVSRERDTMLARMHICNDGQGSVQNPRVGDYFGMTYFGRDARALGKGRISKRGEVTGWRRHDYHVWNLVARMLDAMGYDKGRGARPWSDLPLIDTEGPDLISIAHLNPDQRADVIAHVRGLDEPEEEYGEVPTGGWHCFHCGQHFVTVKGARLHFGPTPDGVATCVAEAQRAARDDIRAVRHG